MANRQHHLTSLADLHASGLIDAHEITNLGPVAERYAIAVTPAVRGLMEPTNPEDPIARQYLPDARELQHLPQELADPIGDGPHSPVPGIVHRYRDRVLLKIVNICPVYCRFCFRREMVGPSHGGMLDETALANALAYIANTPQVEETIMTGGDPLVLSARRIREIVERLSAIAHIKKLRWHTRMPVVAPERITPALIAALMATDRTVRIAVHANHAREFSHAARAACHMLRDAGIELLSQSVLLRGINDDVAALADLVEAYLEVGATPYYLHHGDLAPGTSHFRTSIAAGLKLMSGLAERLPAEKLPAYMLDVPGGSGKIRLMAERVTQKVPGVYQINLPDGHRIAYSDVVHRLSSDALQQAAFWAPR